MRETMAEMIVGNDHMLPSILELFPDVEHHFPSGVSDLNAGDQNDDNGNLSDASETEWKFDPNAVKSEVDEVTPEEADPLEDSFVGDLLAATGSNVESTSQKPKRRRKKKLESDNDDGDETWSLYASKTKKKSKIVKARRDQKLVANERKKVARRKESGQKTVGGVQEENSSATLEPQMKRTPRTRKKVTQMTLEEVEKTRATWRGEKLRQRGSLRTTQRESADDPENVAGNEENTERVVKQNSRRKRVSDMNPEELEKTRIRWREEKKRKDERSRMGSKVRGSENGVEEEVNEGLKTIQSDSDPRPVVKRAAGGRRKRISEMTDEEREVMKARWREESRLKRQRQREKWTEEERREFLAKQNERKRQLRQAMKEKIDPEQKRAVNRKARESKKGMAKTPLTEEQKREAYQRRLLRRLEKEATMTEEEKEEKRQRNALRRLEKEAKMTPEQLEAKKQRKLEYARQRLSRMTEEDRQRRRDKMKEYRDTMSPERKSHFLRGLREAHYRRMKRLRQNPEKLAELKERWQRDKKRRQEYLREWKEKVKSGQEILREEGGLLRAKRGRKPINPDEYTEEQLRRRAEKRKTICVKARIKRRLRVQKMLDSGLTMEEISRRTETPEQRQRRLMRNRIDSAKIRMRKKLEAVGAPPKVIEEKLIEIVETYQPKHAMRPYKPRESRRKPLDESELAILESLERERETKPEPSQHPSPMHVEETLLVPQPVSYVELAPCTSTSVIAYANVTPSSAPVIFTIPAREVTIEYHQVAGDVAHFQQCHYQPHSYPHPQISHVEIIQAPEASQSQTYSLHHILNTMEFHQSQPTASSSVSGTVDNYRPQQIQQDYLSSGASYVAAASPEHSTPHSPIHQQDHSEAIDNCKPDPTELEGVDICKPDAGLCKSKAANKFKPGTRPSKATNDKPVDKQKKKHSKVRSFRKPRTHTNLPDWYKTGVARGPKKKLTDCVLREVVCEHCGHAYAKNYITEHKRQMHNPEFKDGRCMRCGQEFRKAKDWYYHFSHEHLGLPKKPKPGEGKRAKRKQMREMGLIRAKKEFDPLKNPYMCPQCGASYSHPSILESHEYHMHGDGAKEENYYECAQCKKKFKRKHSYISHMRKKHEGYKDLVPCERCDIVFKNVNELNQHILGSHKDSYFPCNFCTAVKLSEVAWRFHTNRCAKVSREQLLELRKQWKENGEPEPVDRLPVNCEFCPRKVLLLNVRRHYKDMHGLDEERMFQCMHCRNTFKSREYYSAHLESVHRVPLEECLEICRKYNRVDREGLLVKNTVGEKGGSKKKVKQSAVRQEKEEEEMSEEESESEPEVKVKKRKGCTKKRLNDNSKKAAKQRRQFKPDSSELDEIELQLQEKSPSECQEGRESKRKSLTNIKRKKVGSDFYVDDEQFLPKESPVTVRTESTRPKRNSARKAQKLIERFQNSESDSEEDENIQYNQHQRQPIELASPTDDIPCDKSTADDSEVKSVLVLGQEEGEPSIKIEFISENEGSESEELHIAS